MRNRRQLLDGLGFAEAPRWHEGRLWLVDFFSGEVIAVDLVGRRETMVKVAGMPGGLGFLPDGTPLVVSQRDFRVLAIGRDGALTVHSDLSGLAVGAANDMCVDRSGRAYVGHHGFDFFGGAARAPASLILVTTDGRAEVVADNLIFPNGMALSKDGRMLVVAESFANRLTAFDVQNDGRLSGRRLFADLGAHTPDGIAMDSEGGVWAGSPMTGAFVRVDSSGAVTEVIEAGNGRWGVACAFVGDGLDSLALLTAETTPDTMSKGQSMAFVDLVDVSIPGPPA